MKLSVSRDILEDILYCLDTKDSCLKISDNDITVIKTDCDNVLKSDKLLVFDKKTNLKLKNKIVIILKNTLDTINNNFINFNYSHCKLDFIMNTIEYYKEDKLIVSSRFNIQSNEDKENNFLYIFYSL